MVQHTLEMWKQSRQRTEVLQNLALHPGIKFGVDVLALDDYSQALAINDPKLICSVQMYRYGCKRHELSEHWWSMAVLKSRIDKF